MGSEPAIFLLACVVSLGLTALVREVAPRIGLTDDPDGHRKLHGRATPLGGGAVIFLTTAVVLGALWLTPGAESSSDDTGGTIAASASSAARSNADASSESGPAAAGSGARPLTGAEMAARETGNEAFTVSHPSPFQDMPTRLRKTYPQLPFLLLAGLIIVVVGLIDDWKGLRGRQKLLGQTLAASVLILGGLVIERVDVFGYQVAFGKLAYPITLLWLLGAINALNLLDGIDGLATMLGIIFSFTIAAMAVVIMSNNQGVAIIAMVFAGSLIGFLRFNFPPATIFLGDSGSMLIGLVVGALAIGGSLKASGTVLLAAPLAIWTLPFFDSAAAILRRKLTGRSIYETDRGHLHHRLLNLLGSNRKVLGWVAACCALLATATLIGLVRKDDRIMFITCFGVVATFIMTGVFGRVELLLLGTRLRGVGRTLVSPVLAPRNGAWQTSIHLQGNQQWDLLWATFVEAADKLQLIRVRLDVNMPTMSEAYHASWQRPSSTAEKCRWHVEIPLVITTRSVGLVRVTGQRNEQPASADIQRLMELIEPFEAKLQSLASNPPSSGSLANGPESQITAHPHTASSPARAAPK